MYLREIRNTKLEAEALLRPEEDEFSAAKEFDNARPKGRGYERWVEREFTFSLTSFLYC